MSEEKSLFSNAIRGIKGGLFSGITGTGVYGTVGGISGGIIGEIVGMILGGMMAGPRGSIIGARVGAKISSVIGSAVFGGYGGISFLHKGAIDGYNNKLSVKDTIKSIFKFETPTIFKVNKENGLTEMEKKYHINKKRILYGSLFAVGTCALATITGVDIIAKVAYEKYEAVKIIEKLIENIPVIMAASGVVGWITGAGIGKNVAKKEIKNTEKEIKIMKKKGLLKDFQLTNSKYISKDDEMLTREDKDSHIMDKRILYGVLGLGLGVIAANLLPVVGQQSINIINAMWGWDIFHLDMSFFPGFMGVCALGGSIIGSKFGKDKGNLEIENLERQQQRDSMIKELNKEKDKIKSREINTPEIENTPQIDKSNSKNIVEKTEQNILNTQDISNELKIVEGQVKMANNNLATSEKKNQLMDELNQAEEQLRFISSEISKKKAVLENLNKSTNYEKPKPINLNNEVKKERKEY